MPTFERGDVIRVPFPYTDRATRQSRPALVVSTARLQNRHGLLWVVMITSAENQGWPDDVPVTNLTMAGLPVPSLIRCAKIATIEGSDASRLGRVSAAQLRGVTRRLVRGLGGE
jgi:mRNA interferase MazF